MTIITSPTNRRGQEAKSGGFTIRSFLQRSLARVDGGYFILVLWSMVWLLAYAFLAPPPPGVDVYLFKQPGLNYAEGHGFVGFALPGMQALGLHAYAFASYTPGYPFLYGLYARIFGISGRANGFFDLCICIAAIFLIAFTIRPWLPDRMKWMTALGLGAVMPSGLVYAGQDRPEALALILFILALFIAQQGHPRWSACLAGCNTLISPFCGAMTGLALWMTMGQISRKENGNWRRHEQIMSAMEWLGFYSIPIAVLILYDAIFDRAAWFIFSQHALGKNSGLGAVFHENYLHSLDAAATMAGVLTEMYALSYLLPFIGILFLLWKAERHSLAAAKLAIPYLLAFMVIPLLAFHRQINYIVWTRTAAILLLGIWLFDVHIVAASAGWRRGYGFLIMILWLCALPFSAATGMIQWKTRTNYVQAQAQAKKFMQLTAKIHPGQPLAVSHFGLFMYQGSAPTAVQISMNRIKPVGKHWGK